MTPHITLQEGSIESTVDCLVILNNYKKSKWKRTSKFGLKVNNETNEVRVFTDGVEYVTLISSEDGPLLCKNLDLSKYRTLIDEIRQVAKHHYTHDYDDLLLNPWDMRLWVAGGDGGILYNDTLSAKEIAKKMEEGWDEGDKWAGDPVFEEKFPSLKISYEAEYSPERFYEEGQDDEEMNFIAIGNITDIGML